MNFLVYLLFLLLEKIIPLFPLKFIQRTARLKGLFFYYFIPVRKNAAYKNLRLAFPEKPDVELKSIIKGAYINVFTVIFEFFYMRKLNDEKLRKLVNPDGLNKIKDKLKKGKGLVIISAHFGNWELTAYGGARIAGVPFNVIVKEQTNSLVDKRINKIRSSAGNKMIDMDNAAREVLAALRRNEPAALLGDQTAPKENSVKVKFFADDVPAFEGAARFAIKTGSPVIFGISARRSDGTYDIIIRDIDISKYKDYTEENIKKFTQEHADILTDFIKTYPDHWLWFHKRFKHVMEY
jgi:Kdo2-lipid IVA lauroyltransferase/acyltransferase